jgi:hypothetical protein
MESRRKANDFYKHTLRDKKLQDRGMCGMGTMRSEEGIETNKVKDHCLNSTMVDMLTVVLVDDGNASRRLLRILKHPHLTKINLKCKSCFTVIYIRSFHYFYVYFAFRSHNPIELTSEIFCQN